MRAPSSKPNDAVVLVAAGMLAAIVVSLFGLYVRNAHGGELMICHLPPIDIMEPEPPVSETNEFDLRFKGER
jgi:hypothetical protein